MLVIVGCRSAPVRELIGRPTLAQIASLEVVSGLPRETVKKEIQDYTPEIAACYQSRRPESPIRLVLRFTIDPSGQVRGLVVDGRSKKVPALESCVTKAIQRIRFTRSDVPSVTEVPSLTIDFYPAESDG